MRSKLDTRPIVTMSDQDQVRMHLDNLIVHYGTGLVALIAKELIKKQTTNNKKKAG